jgi:predicted glycogen debranching enzyme
MHAEAADLKQAERALGWEWLETNGLGGYAASTLAFANTRKHHGLLVVSHQHLAQRVVLVNSVDEWVEVLGGEPLSSHVREDGAVSPDGFQFLTGFDSAPWPTWTFEVGGLRIVRELFLKHGTNAVALGYRLLSPHPHPVRLHVRPLLTVRPYEDVESRDDALDTRCEASPGLAHWRPRAGMPGVVAFHSGEYHHAPTWVEGLEYPMDRERGTAHREDAWCPGEIVLTLAADTTAYVVFAEDGVEDAPYDRWRDEELRRRQEEDRCPEDDPLARALWRQGGTFLVHSGTFTGIVAGYPWFGAWGRDAFASLTGLCLVPGRFEEARAIIRAFAADFDKGLLADDFDPDTGAPQYNTIDAALWFIHAVGDFYEYTGDERFVREVAWPSIRSTLNAYRRGTRYNIRVDADGLLGGHVRGRPLTWMDAVTEGHVHTPRGGTPVEVQGLWLRALDVGAKLARRFDDRRLAQSCAELRRLALHTFERRFWFERGGYLYDVIDPLGREDPSLRPNQLFVLSLAPDAVSPAHARSILEVVEAQLLTPVGVRSLSPGDPRYCPRYLGDRFARDAAYHQGTVWPYLLGVFVKAWLNVYGRSFAQRTRAHAFLAGLIPALAQGAVAHLPEIADGDPPLHPRGCIAQAWSNAELLQALYEEILGHKRPFQLAPRDGGELRAP